MLFGGVLKRPNPKWLWQSAVEYVVETRCAAVFSVFSTFRIPGPSAGLSARSGPFPFGTNN